MNTDIDLINKIIDDPQYSNNVVEYYPKITKLCDNIGNIDMGKKLYDHINNLLNKKYSNVTTLRTIEYIYHEKKLVISELENSREYIQCRQTGHVFGNGMIIMYKKSRIDPNKFPIIDKYDDVQEKQTITYRLRNVIIDIVQENSKIFYIKIIFTCDTNVKKNILKSINEIISLLEINT